MADLGSNGNLAAAAAPPPAAAGEKAPEAAETKKTFNYPLVKVTPALGFMS
jgi:hypothetical protein